MPLIELRLGEGRARPGQSLFGLGELTVPVMCLAQQEPCTVADVLADGVVQDAFEDGHGLDRLAPLQVETAEKQFSIPAVILESLLRARDEKVDQRLVVLSLEVTVEDLTVGWIPDRNGIECRAPHLCGREQRRGQHAECRRCK